MTVLVSACLLGVRCRYDGASKPHEDVMALMAEHTLIPVCPEIMGGLPTPRPPAEVRREKVVTGSGVDVTGQYQKGAEEVLRLAKLYGAKAAILKERSPACGSGTIHNGRFDGGMVDGWGVAAALLRDNGILVLDESEIDTFHQIVTSL